MLKEFLNNSYLFGGNAPFIEELYEKYLANPQSVPDEWRDYFDRMQVLPGSSDKDVAHAPVVESFRPASESGASSPQNAHHADRAGHAGAAAGRGAAAGHGLPHRRLALGDGRSAEAHAAAEHPGARAGVLRPEGSRSRPGGELGLVRRARARFAAGRWFRRCATPIAATSASSTCSSRTARSGSGSRSASSRCAARPRSRRKSRSSCCAS